MRYELWKAARTKSDGNMTSSSATLISQRIFTRPQKQPIHDTVIHEDDYMAEAEDDPLSKLMTKLPRYMDTIVVDQGRSSMYGFVEPQTIQPSGNTLQNRQDYLQTWMDESKRDVYLVPYIEGSHWQLMVIIPKQCKIIWFCSLHRRMKNGLRTMLQGYPGIKKQVRDPAVHEYDDDMEEMEDDPMSKLIVMLLRLKRKPKVVQPDFRVFGFENMGKLIGGERMLNISIIHAISILARRECGYYVMYWIKAIIQAGIYDNWTTVFDDPSPILKEAMAEITHQWASYLLQRED
ncbi:hypothetical protein LR48_Vigan11g114300 [Vigna angularis]|uniref:Ubiquitin-like protease family profile domain-containing protein n=1 Tax=Phaseolus angularis TaxID=3914 RepID=A0A0L9VTM5_PHAAN|nr:hypothetical protein LR48_Vigan11g114300 [Vigna angularis]